MRNVLPLLVGAGLLFQASSQPEYAVRHAMAGADELTSGKEQAWQNAPPISWGPSEHRTEFRALWSAHGLHVRFDVADEEPWHSYERRDDPLWEEEVVEIFIDPSRTGANYAEVEWNPTNVVCDLHVISGMPDKQAEIHWNLEGMQSRTRWNHDREGKTVGWTVIAFLPWSGFGSLPSTKDVALPPQPGDRWRFNVFRIERPGGKDDPDRDVILAAWSPPPGRSFHVPEVFRDLVFTKD